MMDTDKIKSILNDELLNRSSLHLLQVQNHIYGCFVLLEDIAQNTLEVSETSIIYPESTFDFDASFNYIGIKSGFISDNGLVLSNVSDNYKQFWIEQFKTADLLHDISEVDSLEDIIIDYIRDTIPEKDAYFMNALNTGVLSEEWLEKLMKVLEERDIIVMENKHIVKSYNLNRTRRRHQKRSTPIARKKLLNITRRKRI